MTISELVAKLRLAEDLGHGKDPVVIFNSVDGHDSTTECKLAFTKLGGKRVAFLQPIW